MSKFYFHFCKQETPCIVEMPSDENEESVSKEELIGTKLEKKENVDKFPIEDQSATYCTNVGKMIIPTDEGACYFLFE